MSENKGLVKCVLGFLLALIVIVGGIFGLDIDVEVTDDTQNTLVSDDNLLPIVPNSDKITEETPVDTTDNVVDTTESPAESTPTEDGNSVVDESAEAEVTEPTDETENIVTEEGEN